MGKPVPDAWVERARDAFFASHLTLYRLGLAMGYPEESARQDAWQFLYRTPAPPAADVRRFARAVGVSVTSLTRPG
jgi:hypothetical protein